MLTISLQLRSLKCYQHRHLMKMCGFQHTYTERTLRGFSSSSDASASIMTVTTNLDNVVNDTAMSARDVATAIANRLTQKELSYVSKSFSCTANRPDRAARITTKNKIDTTWINDWFLKLHGDHGAIFFPLTIPPAPLLEHHGRELYAAIHKANRHKNSTFFSDLALGKEKSAVTKKRASASIKESDVQLFINQHVKCIPVSMTVAITKIIHRYTAEEISEITLKRQLRNVTGIHGGILPTVIQMMGLSFLTTTYIINVNKAKEDEIQMITQYIEKCNDITRWRREKKATAKEVKKNRLFQVDSVAESLEVSGSHPSTADLMADLDVDTELQTLKKKKPRTTELRRRSLTSEHCLQVTMQCVLVDDYTDDSIGYDDGNDDDDYSRITSQEVKSIDNDNSGYDDNNNHNHNHNSSNVPVMRRTTRINKEYENYLEDVRNKQEERRKSRKIEDDWQYSPYKIFLENMALDLTEKELIKSLRKCGDVNDVKFFRNNGSGLISSALSPPTDQEYITAVELFEKFGIKTDTRVRSDGRGGVRSVLLPKNPLAVISSVRRRPVKKVVAKLVRSDNGAFAIMKGPEGYKRATMDDLRIFGICVAGQNSRIQAVNNMTSIWLETRACISAENIQRFLRTMLGDNFQFTMVDQWSNNGAKTEVEYPTPQEPVPSSKIMPVFAHLKFEDHELAWHVFTTLSAGIDDGAPFRLAWTRTTWYYTVKDKAREMASLNQMLHDDNRYAMKNGISNIMGKQKKQGNAIIDEFNEKNDGLKDGDRRIIEKENEIEIEEEIDEEEYEIQQINNKYVLERSLISGEYIHKVDKILLTIPPMQKIENDLNDYIDQRIIDDNAYLESKKNMRYSN